MYLYNYHLLAIFLYICSREILICSFSLWSLSVYPDIHFSFLKNVCLMFHSRDVLYCLFILRQSHSFGPIYRLFPIVYYYKQHLVKQLWTKSCFSVWHFSIYEIQKQNSWAQDHWLKAHKLFISLFLTLASFWGTFIVACQLSFPL